MTIQLVERNGVIVPDFQLGDVVRFGIQQYVISGFCKGADGIIQCFYVKPFIGDPSDNADITAALQSK